MSLALQEIVDGLAVRLSRSVAIDDRGMRLLAISRHFGDEDSSRVHAVLHREAAAENTSYVLSQGIGQWTRPGRVAARLDLGAAARVCAPVRAEGLLLGYLWLIDAQQTLTEAELSLAQEPADEAGRTLHRELMGEDERRAAESAALLDLVGDDVEQRDAARRWIVGPGAADRTSCRRTRCHVPRLTAWRLASGRGPDAKERAMFNSLLDVLGHQGQHVIR